MAQKFLDYEALRHYCSEHPDQIAVQVLAAMAEHIQPIVSGVGLDDIRDVTEDRDEAGEDGLTPEQAEAALDLYARRFDWVPCHNDLREAIDDVRAGVYWGDAGGPRLHKLLTTEVEPNE